ncbi:MAG: DUF4349 domain-containing protein [Anaerolineaceae bacterium]
MKTRVAVFLAVLLLVLAACSSAQAPTAAPIRSAVNSDSAAGKSVVSAPALPAAQSAESFAANSSSGASATTGGTSADQLVIKNANISIVVDDPHSAMIQVENMTTGLGGYVVTSSESQYSTAAGNDYSQVDITVRVPVGQLDKAMDQIRALVSDPKKDIQNENITGQDVTGTVVDLQSRLRNYQSAADKLNEFLSQAKSTDDTMKVFNQLMTVQEQIDLLQGQIKYYTESAQFSAIAVSIQAKVAIQPVTVAGWQPQGIARDAVQALINFAQWFASVIIWFGLFCLPILVVLGLPLWFTWRSMKKKGWTWKGLHLTSPSKDAPPEK